MKSNKLTFLLFTAALMILSACSKEELFDFLKKETQRGSAGMVFTTTNDPDDNEVVVYERGGDGKIDETGRYFTGGKGTGAGLGSQNAVVWDGSKKLLFVVNAGSDDISVFSAKGKGFKLLDKVSAEGEMPVSLAHYGNLLFVLNAGGSGSIVGFYVSNAGKLSYIPDSKQNLSNDGQGVAPGPAQIEFTPNGAWLVVTEKASNQILLYMVEKDGITYAPVINPSAGQTPFGFSISKKGVLAVSEAFGGAENASVLSTYNINSDGTISVISDQIATTQTAACWVVITKNQKYVYTTNTGSGTLSSFNLQGDGSVNLLEAEAGFDGTGTTPIDMALSGNSKFLYALNSGDGSINVYEINADGSLEDVEKMDGLPLSSAGIAAQ